MPYALRDHVEVNLQTFQHWNEKEIESLNKHLLLTAKPIVYLVNLSETDYIRKVSWRFTFTDSPFIFSCSFFDLGWLTHPTRKETKIWSADFRR